MSETAPEEQRKTQFVILYRSEGGPWAEAPARVEANGQSSAKQQFVEGSAEEVLEVVAVPIRSWKPEKFRAQTQRIVSRVSGPTPEPEE